MTHEQTTTKLAFILWEIFMDSIVSKVIYNGLHQVKNVGLFISESEGVQLSEEDGARFSSRDCEPTTSAEM
jgi:hypothetical protein